MEKSIKPPYVSYRTFLNTLDLWRTDGAPSVVDPSILKSMSGATYSQFTIALRFLGLLDEAGRTPPLLAELAYADNEARKPILRSITESSYDFLFNDPSFDLSVASPKQFRDKFRDTEIDGDTLRKAETFFLHLAANAGIKVSRYIMSGRSSADKPASSKNQTRKTPKKPKQIPVQDTEDRPPTATRNDATKEWERKMKEMLLERLSDKYPPFNPEWDAETQQKWFDGWLAFTEMMGVQIAPNDDDEKEVGD